MLRPATAWRSTPAAGRGRAGLGARWGRRSICGSPEAATARSTRSAGRSTEPGLPGPLPPASPVRTRRPRGPTDAPAPFRRARRGAAAAPAAAELPDLGGREVDVVTENAYPPLQFVDPATGEAVGWEYDAMNEIAKRLNFA